LPIAHGIAARERIDGAPLYSHPDAGHFVHLEAVDRLVPDRVGFLQSSHPVSPRILDEKLLARWREQHPHVA
jgi:hypothetical protein